MVVPYEGKAEYGEEGEDEGEDGGEVVPQVGRVRHVHQAHHLRVYSTVCTLYNHTVIAADCEHSCFAKITGGNSITQTPRKKLDKIILIFLFKKNCFTVFSNMQILLNCLIFYYQTLVD